MAASSSAVPIICEVRARRESLHLRSGELAAQCGITRQALHAIETAASVPNTLIALRLAQALGCRVEELFRLPEHEAQAQVVGAPAQDGGRVQLAWVGNCLLAFPVAGEAGWGQAADGTIALPEAGAARGRVQFFTEPARARRTAVLVGCDPSLGVAASHAGFQTPDARLLWRPASSLEALRSVARGEAHAAGIHLWDAGSGVSNLPFVRRELTGERVHLYTLWAWEQGLMVASGNPQGVTGVADLLRPGVRLVNRQEGSGCRALLDAWLSNASVTAEERRSLPGYRTEARTHLEAAAQVAAGLADAAPGPRSAALALGLDFVPMQRERFDLVVPDAHLNHPAIQALLTVARTPTFRTEIASLGGYDPSHAGELWQSTG